MPHLEWHLLYTLAALVSLTCLPGPSATALGNVNQGEGDIRHICMSASRKNPRSAMAGWSGVKMKPVDSFGVVVFINRFSRQWAESEVDCDDRSYGMGNTE